jgi:hypothetical protein
VLDSWLIGGLTLAAGLYGLYALRAEWRAEGIDVGRAPEWWPFDVVAWRGLVRAGPMGAVEAPLMGGAIIASGLEQAALGDALRALAYAVLALMIAVFLLNRPSPLVVPRLRGLPGAIEEWREGAAGPGPEPAPSSLRIERRRSPNFAPGRDGHMPRGIVVHTTDGSFAGAVAWLSNPESRVSAHYVVGLDGRVLQLVDEGDTARHAGRVRDPTAALIGGDDDPNLFTVGIEFEDGGDPEHVARPDEQYAAGAALIGAVAGRWGIPLDREHVIGHREVFAAKLCPGNLDVERLVAEARAHS